MGTLPLSSCARSPPVQRGGEEVRHNDIDNVSPSLPTFEPIAELGYTRGNFVTSSLRFAASFCHASQVRAPAARRRRSDRLPGYGFINSKIHECLKTFLLIASPGRPRRHYKVGCRSMHPFQPVPFLTLPGWRVDRFESAVGARIPRDPNCERPSLKSESVLAG